MMFIADFELLFLLLLLFPLFLVFSHHFNVRFLLRSPSFGNGFECLKLLVKRPNLHFPLAFVEILKEVLEDQMSLLRMVKPVPEHIPLILQLFQILLNLLGFHLFALRIIFVFCWALGDATLFVVTVARGLQFSNLF